MLILLLSSTRAAWWLARLPCDQKVIGLIPDSSRHYHQIRWNVLDSDTAHSSRDLLSENCSYAIFITVMLYKFCLNFSIVYTGDHQYDLGFDSRLVKVYKVLWAAEMWLHLVSYCLSFILRHRHNFDNLHLLCFHLRLSS